jgi:hypothetical protein
MKLISFARWEIEYDPATTRELFSRVQLGAPEACGCTPCRNFAAARERAYPAEVVKLMGELGIATDREADLYHVYRVGPGNHLYGDGFILLAE